MQSVSQPYSLIVCVILVEYKLCTHSCLFSTFPLGYSTAAQFLSTRGSSLSASWTTRTSRRSSPSRRPCGALLRLRRAFIVFVLRFRCIRHFVINVINNICISIYYILFVICAVIYCSFYCIYVWLDPGTYMIARFMSFYKPGVTPRLGMFIRTWEMMQNTQAWESAI